MSNYLPGGFVHILDVALSVCFAPQLTQIQGTVQALILCILLDFLSWQVIQLSNSYRVPTSSTIPGAYGQNPVAYCKPNCNFQSIPPRVNKAPVL